MLKKILLATAMLWASASFAADVNKASAAELDSVKGIGPSLSTRILDERKKGEFKNWDDFMQRMKGVKDARAAKLSAEGLTVNGEAFKGAGKPAGKAAAKVADKAAAKAEAAPAKP
ncbi:ComEA family DNA-binding protein [Variovorax sp. VNK109]|uniref:ComEA family DNA-binding protein n=1 Tax=Variovorax sp. VNK109 TaxID=3400919 RepID=UPI003BFD1FAB